MNFSEGSYYKLQKDYYECIKLECTWANGSCAYFAEFGAVANYKLILKTSKLYKWNDKFKSWDNVENTLSEYGAEDIWSKRLGVESYHYDGLGKGD